MDLTRRRLVSALAPALLAVALALAADAAADIDDAAITYRYAENVAAGRGFVYNAGRPVWGTTTPLFTLLLAPLVAAGVPVAGASLALGLIGVAATAALAAVLAEILCGARGASWFAGLWCAVAAPVSVWAVSGMETLPYTALLLSVWVAVGRGHWTGAAALAGLAFLMRPDGLVCLLALLPVAIAAGRRLPLRETGAWLAVIAPWMIFAWWRFGEVLPSSLAAKQTHVKVADPLWFAAYFGEPRWWPALAVVVLGGWSLLRQPGRRGLTAAGVLLWTAGYGLAYTVIGIDYYEWYCVPAVPFLGVLAAGAAGRLAALLAGSRRRQRVLVAVLALLCAGPLLAVRGSYVQRQRDYMGTVEIARVAVGRWLRDNTEPDAVVAAGAIGHIGLQSRRTILDLGGLIGETSGPYDYLVSEDGYPSPSDRAGTDPRFLRWHRLVARFAPGAPYGHLVQKVFRHLDAPSGLPDALLFRNGILPDDPSLSLPEGVLDLATPAAARHLGAGWSLPEADWGTWAVTTRSVLDVVLEPAHAYRVELTLAPMDRPGHVQHLAVEHNGRTVLEPTPLAAGFQKASFVLPAGTVDDGVQRLTLTWSYAVSPRDLGQSDDTRPLAAVVRTLRVEPLDGKTPS